MKDNFTTTLYQGIVLVLLVTLLVVGFFHFGTLSTAQQGMTADIQLIREQYVQLQTYIGGQTQQDQMIKQLQGDLEDIKKNLQKQTGKQ